MDYKVIDRASCTSFFWNTVYFGYTCSYRTVTA